MATDSFILELKLNTRLSDIHILNKRFRVAEKMYNALLSYELKQLKLMKESKKHRKLIKEYANAPDSKTKKEIGAKLNLMTKEYELTEYQMHTHMKKYRYNYKTHIDANTGQKIATAVYKAIESNLYKGSKKVHFKKYNSLTSVEGKDNKSGILFRDNKLKFLGLDIPAIIRKGDLFAEEALMHRVKYCRIVKKIIRNNNIYYLQLILEGIPPAKKINSTGKFRHKIATDGKVGIDIGTSSIAIATKDLANLKELAPNSECFDKQINNLKRRLDRSRRATNPQNFNDDKTIKKGIKLNWVRSNNYIKTLYQIKEMSRLKTVYMKESHNKLCNYIISLGNECYIETMSFDKLAKRKERSKDKNGKEKSRKAFGKSIGSKAPALLMEILERKLSYQSKNLNKIDTFKFRASQYHHDANVYLKQPLSKRYKEINFIKVQRDLYSAFLLMNSKKSLKETDRNLCKKGFNDFAINHNIEINRLISSKEKTPLSFGVSDLI